MSPTLSPTLSAITAGFLGSSSGIPISVLPTKSAPISAAFVKIPPPIRLNKAVKLAPIEKPVIISSVSATLKKLNSIYITEIPKIPILTEAIPITEPPEIATFKALF